MQELYNCKRIDSKHYKITKFDNHLNPKRDHTGRASSYVVSENGCDCPQGHAQSCRHRKMLPFFLEHDYVDTEYFFVWDTRQWYKASGVADARRANGRKEPPKPITAVMLDDPAVLHNTTAKAIGEPTLEGGQLPVSAAPSPQPSPIMDELGDIQEIQNEVKKANAIARTYRRF